MKERNKTWLLVATIILVIVGIYFLEQQRASNANKPYEQKPNNGEYDGPEIEGIDRWINSEPLQIADLEGKVVLIDFWTYSCINCIRTLPYITDWHEKYEDDGLVIIGVHTPEFAFEKKYDNVLKAVEKYNINYPVAMDNDFDTWRNFRNRYWPRKYLIDKTGEIVYDHIGEGAYEETELKIQELLNQEVELSDPNGTIEANFSALDSPEIYFGRKFTNEGFGEPVNSLGDNTYELRARDTLPSNTPTIEGTWKFEEEYIELVSDEGKLALLFKARDVNIVAESEEGTELEVFINTELVTNFAGYDIVEGIATVDEPRLYNLVASDNYRPKILFINIKGKGFRLNTFTFG